MYPCDGAKLHSVSLFYELQKLGGSHVDNLVPISDVFLFKYCEYIPL
ncbi:hypothetical protein NSE_0835 [Neorickettsia sennetsu str. Miyayama]|uniref:Uncharacterized protein n=1 Tax=Ehrlichia sennetsu (strain ATCC VR-367 / Miyayama) TaxID=222891 RepID=Q2GCU2_EHRS3|nr:hypothetical protein NSE_0835 [Neorickettsia sennetsu str. Miyayama]